MHNKHTHTRKLTTPVTASIAVLACLGLAACGGSSSTSSTSTTNAANTATTAKSGGAGRFAAMRECLQRNGITLPARPAGAGGPGVPGGVPGGPAGVPGGGPRQLPKGVTREQFQAALKKCGGGAGFAGGARRSDNPAYRNALTAYAACMKNNGITLPTANTSGNGPVFNTTGVNTSSAQFKAAAAKCQSVLRSAFGHFRRARPGTETGGA
jgi:hypothetical protein